MFNVDITGMFAGAYPDTVLIPAHLHASAVSFYKAKLHAREVSKSKAPVTLQSSYGFRLKVDRISASYSTGGSIRLSLGSSVDRAKVAKSLSGGAKVRKSRSGLVTTDPFGVTWTLA